MSANRLSISVWVIKVYGHNPTGLMLIFNPWRQDHGVSQRAKEIFKTEMKLAGVEMGERAHARVEGRFALFAVTHPSVKGSVPLTACKRHIYEIAGRLGFKVNEREKLVEKCSIEHELLRSGFQEAPLQEQDEAAMLPGPSNAEGVRYRTPVTTLFTRSPSGRLRARSVPAQST